MSIMYIHRAKDSHHHDRHMYKITFNAPSFGYHNFNLLIIHFPSRPVFLAFQPKSQHSSVPSPAPTPSTDSR